MAETSLQLKIISAKGLNKVNLVGKMAVYAVVYITGEGNQDQKQKTDVDKDGDSNPTWNHPMKFMIDECSALQDRLTLVVNIKTEGLFGDKDLGEVHIPIKELLEGYSTGGKPLQFVSYQVMKPSGKPKGELNFSYKFGENEPVAAYPVVDFGSSSLYPPLYAAPVDTAPGIYAPQAVIATAGLGSYPPVGSAYYPPAVAAEYSQPQVGYAYQQQLGYDGYPPLPTPWYEGYPPYAGYGYPPVQQPQHPI